MTDLIKRDDALAACDIAPPDEWNDYTKGGYDFAAEECRRNIAALPANPVVNDPAADRIEELMKERDDLGRKLNTARYGQPDFAWSIHVEAMADLRAKLAKAMAGLRKIADHKHFSWDQGWMQKARIARDVLAELEGGK